MGANHGLRLSGKIDFLAHDKLLKTAFSTLLNQFLVAHCRQLQIPMTKLKNDTFLRALKKQPVPYTPIWVMRQAIKPVNAPEISSICAKTRTWRLK